MTTKYRKKPIVVEALQFGWDTWEEMREFVGVEKDISSIGGCIEIKMRLCTLAGWVLVQENDYIIKGIKGEYYPCKPDIFEETYEEVEDA